MNGWFTGFGHDIKYAIRGLGKSRMFTLVCLLTLAFGFGIDVTLVTLFHWSWSGARSRLAPLWPSCYSLAA